MSVCNELNLDGLAYAFIEFMAVDIQISILSFMTGNMNIRL